MRAIILAIYILILCTTMACQTTKVTNRPEQKVQELSAEHELVEEVSRVEYFSGETAAFSADGKTAFGPPQKTLAKRYVSSKEKKIIEEVWFHGVMNKTVLNFDGKKSFMMDEKDKGFTGQITVLDGDVWNWQKWSYNISLLEQKKKLIGEGVKNASGFSATKKILNESGTAEVLVKDSFTLINEAEFKKLKLELETAQK